MLIAALFGKLSNYPLIVIELNFNGRKKFWYYLKLSKKRLSLHKKSCVRLIVIL